MASSNKTCTVEEVINKIFESDEGEQLSEIDSEVDSENEVACNRASLMFIDDAQGKPKFKKIWNYCQRCEKYICKLCFEKYHTRSDVK